MEGDAALGVASLALEACKLSVTLYYKYCEQCDGTKQLSDSDLEKELNQLKTSAANVRLRTRPPLPAGRSSTNISEHAEALADLSMRTSHAVDNFLAVLQPLRHELGQSKVQSLRKGLMSMSSSSALEKARKEIDDCQRNINFHRIAYLIEGQNLTAEYLAEIISNQKHQSNALQHAKDEITDLLLIQHKTYQAAIFGLRGGKAKAIMGEASLSATHNGAPNATFTTKTFAGASGNAVTESTTGDFQYIIDLVGECLRFDRISDRRNAIRQAHFATFEWIFSDGGTDAQTQAFSSFPEWLERGQGCYWIEGKAGSGKSTLMKRIIDSSDTQKHLAKWAGEQSLSTATFFFWYMGTTPQKSKEGMLRSLLHTLLHEIPQTVLCAIPDLLVEASKLERGMVLDVPSFIQLERWFMSLIKECETQGIKLCLFIDGLDEDSGNKTELAKFFLDVTRQNPNVKFVLAGRPLAVFASSFSELPGLRVQDLTDTDIRNYVSSLLSKGSSTVSDKDIKDLTETISLRSQGVFLWAVVVVKSVLEGLGDGDTVSELQHRVNELPTELEDLYKRMLDNIGPRYQAEAAEMLLLVATVFDPTHPDQSQPMIDPFPAAQFVFALEGQATAMAAPIKAASDEEIQENIHWLKPRIQSRCLGLIELRDRSEENSSDSAHMRTSGKRLLSQVIEPFHRTAIEFLRDEKVSSRIRCYTQPSFDPFQSLFASILRMAKIAPSFFPPKGSRELPPWYHTTELFRLTSDAARQGRQVDAKCVSELDRVLSLHWSRWASHNAPAQHVETGWLTPILYASHGPEAEWIPDELYEEHFPLHWSEGLRARLLQRAHAIGFTRIQAVTWRPDDLQVMLPGTNLLQSDYTLLLHALLETMCKPSATFLGMSRRFAPTNKTALEAVLAMEADPNDLSFDESKGTLWVRFLQSIRDHLNSSRSISDGKQDGDALLTMVKAFVRHGADLSVTLKAKLRDGDVDVCPSEYIRIMHVAIAEHMSKMGTSEMTDSMADKKFDDLFDGLGAIKDFLREQENEAGIHDRKLGFSPLHWWRMIKHSRKRSGAAHKGNKDLTVRRWARWPES